MGIMLQVEHLSAGVTDEDLLVRFGDYGIVESATMARFARRIRMSIRSCRDGE
jgi:hypothetical protein